MVLSYTQSGILSSADPHAQGFSEKHEIFSVCPRSSVYCTTPHERQQESQGMEQDWNMPQSKILDHRAKFGSERCEGLLAKPSLEMVNNFLF